MIWAKEPNLTDTKLLTIFYLWFLIFLMLSWYWDRLFFFVYLKNLLLQYLLLQWLLKALVTVKEISSVMNFCSKQETEYFFKVALRIFSLLFNIIFLAVESDQKPIILWSSSIFSVSNNLLMYFKISVMSDLFRNAGGNYDKKIL